MPPKSSSVGWPRHGTTASKSGPVFPLKCTPIPRSSALPSTSSQDDQLAPPPPSNTTVKSFELSKDDSGLLFSSPEKKSALQTENSSLGESSPHVSFNAEPQEKALISVSPNKIDAGDETQEKKLGGSSNLNAEVEIRPENSNFPDCCSEKAAVDADGVRIVVEGGKRKVVKRVKVIKKVVKRVIKKVPKGSLESSETERVGNVGNLNENIRNLETKLNVSQSEQIEKADPIDIDSVKDGRFERSDVAPLGVGSEGSGEIKVDSMQVENIGSSAEPISGVGISSDVSFADNSDENEGEGIPNQIEDDKDSGYLVVEQNAVLVEEGASEVKLVQNEIEDDKDIGDFVEDQNDVQVEEGACEVEEVVREFVENNSAGLSGDFVVDQNTVQVEDGAGEAQETVKEFLENHGECLNGRVAVSGEIEAVERRRRRQTEIFLGGLDKHAKVEDIQKVFEQVGEVTEVRLKMNSKSGKNKGFAFVRFASAADAKKALAKYTYVVICGKHCAVQPVEDNDTLFLSNINKKWKDHDVIRLLQHEGIEKIDRVTVKANPNNLEQNRGFAFVELETSKDAKRAYNKLQKNYVFNEQLKIKVAWAQPLARSDNKEVLKVNVKVSLANPQKRSKQKKHVLSSTGKEHSRHSILKVHEPGNKRIHTSKSHEVISDRARLTTVELIHLLRQQQAAGRPMQAGSSDLNYPHSSSGSKRVFHELDDYALSSDRRGFLCTRCESSPLTGNLSSFPHHIGSVPLPYSQQQSSGYTFESSNGIPNNPQFQTRERPLSFGHSHIYRRCM